MMLASTLDNIGILDAAVVAVLGYAVVFFGLITAVIIKYTRKRVRRKRYARKRRR